ncbi:DUF6916 family protein [Leifsonia sp. NPDC058230]|uniref:DUF6916 family protein n=1 Tax=Leifsonia sp. NPDC058230 TaxID=3346391 RepID=UPI0036D97835
MTADYERWSAVVGTEFGATDEAGRPHTLRLDSCSPLSLSGEWASFVLTFGTESDDAAQGTYLLTAGGDPADDPEAVFLVPIGRREVGVDLEAVFNQRNEDHRG